MRRIVLAKLPLRPIPNSAMISWHWKSVGCSWLDMNRPNGSIHDPIGDNTTQFEESCSVPSVTALSRLAHYCAPLSEKEVYHEYLPARYYAVSSETDK